MSTAKLTFNPFTGTFDYIFPEDHHGGYTLIPSGTSVTVEENKAIFALDDITVEGTLTIRGTLVVL